MLRTLVIWYAITRYAASKVLVIIRSVTHVSCSESTSPTALYWMTRGRSTSWRAVGNPITTTWASPSQFSPTLEVLKASSSWRPMLHQWTSGCYRLWAGVAHVDQVVCCNTLELTYIYIYNTVLIVVSLYLFTGIAILINYR